MTSNNMYRVGDFVYFEVSASTPYQIRKIEELNKTSTGAVEAKVVCFYRRRDLSQNLIQLADRHQKELSDLCNHSDPELLHQIRHRELFISRHVETLPATHIRGKCTVTLHNDSEPCDVYLSKDDAFFFQLVYDPVQKTLQADRGSMREGSEYQADVPPYKPPEEGCMEGENLREELRWKPDNDLEASELDSYVLLCRSLATLGRAYCPATSLRQPSLTMSAAAATRDSTLQLALDTLHSVGYSVPDALRHMAPHGQPLLKLDEMEQWSVSEGNLFEEALDKYGKCFYDIQNDFLPWKHPKCLIEFYYMWKTTDHYIQQKRIKATEAEHHLKQVYIPNYNKPNPAVLYPTHLGNENPTPACCEGCSTMNSIQWYALGPANSPLKVCTDCWAYWKRYGDLKAASILDKMKESASSSTADGMKQPHQKCMDNHGVIPHLSGDIATSRVGVSFQFLASCALRIARRLSSQLIPRRQGREPFSRSASTAAAQRDMGSKLCHLTSSQIQRMIKRILGCRSLKADAVGRSAHLNLLLSRLFPTRCPVTATNGNVKSDSQTQKPTPSIPSAAGNPVTVVVNNNHNASKACDPRADRKRPSSMHSNEDQGLVTCPLKRPVYADKASMKANELSVLATNPVDRGLLVVGPRRRLSMGSEENGALTLMYRASDTIKRNRRKIFTVAELRRLGRRPWFVRNGSTLSSVQGPVTFSSSSQVGSEEREQRVNQPLLPSKSEGYLRKELKDNVAVKTGSSNSNLITP
ncbi:unnamed protein product [Calicophoron daubneyi]|uniref:Uncharacterized protein n=1 Tax=Calicophoron daubneyi TaxID=300641 RepID=A0AAV2TAP3_CALDB